MKNIIDKEIYSVAFESKIIGKTIEEIQSLIDLPIEKRQEEYVFLLKTYFFGFIKIRLYIYMQKGVVSDYFIGI